MKNRYLLISFLIVASIIYSVIRFIITSTCIPSGNSQDIQKIVDKGRRHIKLCQGSSFELTEPVTLKFTNQELFTIGYPTNSVSKAVLKLVGSDNSLAVNAYNVDGAKIQNIKVDGNRRELGQLVSHGLILVGGNVSSQTVSEIEAYDSRSWTTIHVNRGDWYRDETDALHSLCSGVVVQNNLIGPSGETIAGKWSDGISLQCENSLVTQNTITDVTDGGIVIFGASGSLISDNEIVADKSPLLVGIAMVDYAYEGNYRNTLVKNNTIEARNSAIKAGIAMGPSTWGCNERDKFNYGGIVRNNELIGEYFGYGLVVSGVTNWVVKDNRVDANFIDSLAFDCQNKPNSKPGPYIFDKEKSNGEFQREFKSGHVETVHTIQL